MKESTKEKLSGIMKNAWKQGILKPSYGHLGRQHSEQTKNRISNVLKDKEISKGDKNYFWNGGLRVGDLKGYSATHSWIRKHFGQPDTCEMCGKSGLSGRKIQWANKDGEYKRDLTTWLRLCTPCHRQYDYKNITKQYAHTNY